MKTISASDANRRFSLILRQVEQGRHFTVTSRGRPVATITPAQTDLTDRSKARSRLIERLRQQPVAGERGWARSELYD